MVGNNEVQLVKTIDEALLLCNHKNIETLWIIGGNQLYNTFYSNYSNLLNSTYVSYITGDYNCDVIFNKELLKDTQVISSTMINPEVQHVIYKHLDSKNNTDYP